MRYYFFKSSDGTLLEDDIKDLYLLVPLIFCCSTSVLPKERIEEIQTNLYNLDVKYNTPFFLNQNFLNLKKSFIEKEQNTARKLKQILDLILFGKRNPKVEDKLRQFSDSLD